MSINHLPDHAKVWVYQSNRLLEEHEEKVLSQVMASFVSQWKAHGTELAAGFEIRDHRWLILAVDETQQNATGCSIDSSVHLIKDTGEKLGVDFFDRQLIIYEQEGDRNEDRMHDFWAKRKAGVVNDSTIVFNTLAKDLGELRSKWATPFVESWHAEMW